MHLREQESRVTPMYTENEQDMMCTEVSFDRDMANSAIDCQSSWPTSVNNSTWLTTGTTSSVTRPIPSPLQSPSAVDPAYNQARCFESYNARNRWSPTEASMDASAKCQTTSYRNFGNGLYFCDTSIRNGIEEAQQSPASGELIEGHALDYVDDRLLLDLIEDLGLQQSKELPDLGAAPLMLDSLPWRSAVQLMV